MTSVPDKTTNADKHNIHFYYHFSCNVLRNI